MCPAKWNALEARILHLEAQNRCFRRLLLCAGLLVTVIVAAGANTSRTVEAQRFVLTSADGQMRAELTTLDGQYPRLALKSPDGTKSTELSPLGVSVIDESLSGKLPLSHLGNTGLYLTDKRGKVVIELGGASVSGPQLASVVRDQNV